MTLYPFISKAMMASHHHHLQINTISSVQSPPPLPPLLPKPQTEKPFLLPLAVIAVLVVAQILLLTFTVLRKCLSLCCNHETLDIQSPSCATLSSNQNPNKPEPLGGVISLITYNTTPSDPSGSSSEIFGHTSCSICLGEYENGEKIAVLRNCKHVFHGDCIRQWLPKMSVLCPVCRDPVMDLKAAKFSGSGNSQGNRLPSSSFVVGTGIHQQRQFI